MCGRRAAPRRAIRRLQRRDQPQMRRLVVWVALDDAQEVLGGSASSPRARAGRRRRPPAPRCEAAPPSPRTGPLRGSRRSRPPRRTRAAAAPPPASPIAGREARSAVSKNDSTSSSTASSESRIAPSVGHDEMVLGRAIRAGSRTDRSVLSATESRLPRRARILLGPERLDQLFARHGLPAARGEDLQQVARLLRLPLFRGNGLAVAEDAEAAERLERERRGASVPAAIRTPAPRPPVRGSRAPAARARPAPRRACSRNSGERELDSLWPRPVRRGSRRSASASSSRAVSGTPAQNASSSSDSATAGRAPRRRLPPPPSRRARLRVRARLARSATHPAMRRR